MNNEEKDLKNVEVANETEKNARFGRKNKQKGARIIFTISNGDFYIAQCYAILGILE